MKSKLAIIALGVLALTACSKLTKENYDKLETDSKTHLPANHTRGNVEWRQLR